jgi:hypothetical protein
LATAGYDGTALVWDLWRTTNRPDGQTVKSLSQSELQTCWANLANPNGARAYGDICCLIEHGDSSVGFLEKQLLNAVGQKKPTIKQWIDDLESETYSVRHAASENLMKLGRIAEPNLLTRLESKPLLETQQRIKMLLHGMRVFALPPEQLRQSRAIHILETISSSKAKALLLKLANGDPDMWQTRQSVAACKRLGLFGKSSK